MEESVQHVVVELLIGSCKTSAYIHPFTTMLKSEHSVGYGPVHYDRIWSYVLDQLWKPNCPSSSWQQSILTQFLWLYDCELELDNWDLRCTPNMMVHILTKACLCWFLLKQGPKFQSFAEYLVYCITFCYFSVFVHFIRIKSKKSYNWVSVKPQNWKTT